MPEDKRAGCWQSQQTARGMQKPARQGSKLAGRGACADASDRRRHVRRTQEAKIASDFFFIRAIFAFAGFAGVLKRLSCLKISAESPSISARILSSAIEANNKNAHRNTSHAGRAPQAAGELTEAWASGAAGFNPPTGCGSGPAARSGCLRPAPSCLQKRCFPPAYAKPPRPAPGTDFRR